MTEFGTTPEPRDLAWDTQGHMRGLGQRLGLVAQFRPAILDPVIWGFRHPESSRIVDDNVVVTFTWSRVPTPKCTTQLDKDLDSDNGQFREGLPGHWTAGEVGRQGELYSTNCELNSRPFMYIEKRMSCHSRNYREVCERRELSHKQFHETRVWTRRVPCPPGQIHENWREWVQHFKIFFLNEGGRSRHSKVTYFDTVVNHLKS